MIKHYHVLVGLEGGYMPDTNHFCKTLQEAIQCAIEEKEISLDCGMQVSGNIRHDRLYICTPSDAEAYTLNTLIEITECAETECNENDNG